MQTDLDFFIKASVLYFLLIVGSSSRFGRIIFNGFIRSQVSTVAMGNAWLKHNKKEVGNFELFLPELYNGRTNEKIERIPEKKAGEHFS